MDSPHLGIYLHIPFCKSKCAYCAFDSYRHSEDRMASYVAAVCTEIERSARVYENRRIESVFFGGGTPSLLSPEQAQNLLTALERSGYFLNGAEITIEANPGTVTLSLLEGYRDVGINRISFGAEILDDTALQALGRIHLTEDVAAAVRWARAAQFENVNLDFIYGLPGQTLAIWRQTLKAALDLEPDHISAYALQLEEGTRLTHDVAAGRLTIPSDDEVLDMEKEGIRMLASRKYVRYEISNYARPGKQCRHNLLYWHHDNVRGFGSSAHSYINGRHITNICRPEEYNARIHAGQSPAASEESLDLHTRAREAIAFGLRLMDGVSLDGVAARYGVTVRQDLLQPLSQLKAEGLVVEEGDRLKLTSLGIRFADRVGMAVV